MFNRGVRSEKLTGSLDAEAAKRAEKAVEEFWKGVKLPASVQRYFVAVDRKRNELPQDAAPKRRKRLLAERVTPKE